MQAQIEREEKKAECISLATWAGLRACALAGAVSAPAVLAANHYSRAFRTGLGFSGKLACVVIPCLGSYTLTSELTLIDARDYPEKYNLDSGKANIGPISQNVVREGGLGLQHRAVNWFNDHPFQLLAGCSAPVVLGIFYTQRKSNHLKLSQKIMHTRVIGQASVLSFLIGLMLFRDYMDREGKYLEAAERDANAQTQDECLRQEAQELIREAAYLKMK